MSKKDGKVSRRETLKLASAVSALGVGLGVTLDSSDAEAAPAQIAAAGVGQLTIKLYKLGKEGARDGGVQLLHAFELGALSHKGAKEIAGQYAIKMYNIKNEKTELVAEQPIELSTAFIKQ